MDIIFEVIKFFLQAGLFFVACFVGASAMCAVVLGICNTILFIGRKLGLTD